MEEEQPTQHQTVEQILSKDEARLQKDLGGDLSIRQIRAKIQAAAHSLPAPVFHTVASIVATPTERRLPTGMLQLDEIIHGGFLTGHVSELFGASGAGKTQICLDLMANTIMNGYTVMMVDSSNTFSVTRLLTIVRRLGGTDKDMTRCMVVKVFDCMSLLAMLDQLRENNNKPTSLLVIDSIVPLLAPLTGGWRNHPHSSSLANNLVLHVARALKQYAYECNVAIVVTNGVIDGSRPALGTNWSFVPTLSLFVERLQHQTRVRIRKGASTSQEIIL